MRYLIFALLFLPLPLAVGGCGAEQPQAIEGTQVMMDHSRQEGFYDAPFPSAEQFGEDGSIQLTQFPNPRNVSFVKKVLAIVNRDTRGYSRMGGVFFRLNDAIDPSKLPTSAQSLSPEASMFLMGISKGGSDYLKRLPITTHYEADGGPMGAKHLLSMLPVQGILMQPKQSYVAVVMRSLGDAKGEPLGVSLRMSELHLGVNTAAFPAHVWNRFQEAVAALKEAGIDTKEVAGLTTFTTEDPTEGLRTYIEHLRQKPLPSLQKAWTKTDQFDDYCVYQSELELPVFQAGEPPFLSGGGEWQSLTTPKEVTKERARIVVTLPRQQMPEGGWPVVLFVRTGGGGDRPLVDRGVRAKPGGPAVTPGTGPALTFAKAGWAGVSVDGPHGGLRNITKGDEQFLIFNIINPGSLRDNIRQSALELALMARILQSLQLEGKDCTGLTSSKGKHTFQMDTLTLMGHSMGATIGPLAVASEPLFKAMILSGAGGSWIENIIHKQSPLAVKPLAELTLQYDQIGRELTTHDPVLSLLQWAGDPADPAQYAHQVIHQPLQGHLPRHVLMLQGIIDTYIMPPIANTLSLSLGLDLAGPSKDKEEPKLKEFVPLTDLLSYAKRSTQALPSSANLTVGERKVMGLVVQHVQGPVEDGHEVVFQTEGPKHQYRCFLESLKKGTPHIPPAGKSMMDPCQ